MEKFLAITICLAMAFPLVACNNDINEDDLKEIHRQGYEEGFNDVETRLTDGEYTIEVEPYEEGIYYVILNDRDYDIDYDKFDPPQQSYE